MGKATTYEFGTSTKTLRRCGEEKRVDNIVPFLDARATVATPLNLN
jgi:hypothetical protein